MRLARAILTSPWMLEPSIARSALPAAIRLLKGEPVDFGQITLSPYAYHVSTMKKVRYSNFANAPSGSIAVYPVKGMITKADQLCGPLGTETLMQRMSQADEQPSIVGHLLEIDSGGGEGTNMETVARFIRNEIKKPVVAWFNGMAASAAYYMASAADKIYASEPTDQVGSIGVLVTFADFQDFYEQQGIKIHEIYADQSSLKNSDIREAMEGNYERLKKGFINPYAAQFIRTIQEMRPMAEQEEIYQGEIFNAAEGEKIGLIDGIRTYSEAIAELLRMAEEKPYYQTENKTEMNRINAILGYELEITDGGAFLREEELAMLDRNLTPKGFTAVKDEEMSSLQDKLTAMQTTIDQLSEHVERLDAQFERKMELLTQAIQQNAGRLEKLEESPGAGPAFVAKSNDNYQQGGDDPLAQLERMAHEAAKDGGSLRIN